MTAPKSLWRVEWAIAVHPDRPNERTERSANFASAERAGSQVASIRPWEPRFAELLGVWRTSGWQGELEWELVDPDSLPVSGRHGALVAGWQDNPAYQALIERDDG